MLDLWSKVTRIMIIKFSKLAKVLTKYRVVFVAFRAYLVVRNFMWYDLDYAYFKEMNIYKEQA